MDIIGLATPEVADEIHRLREENARLKDRVDALEPELQHAEREWADARGERDEARAEAKKYHDALVARHGGEPVALLEELDASKAEVKRLEGLILDWDDCWRLDPFQDPGAAARGDEGLMAEARRIRAQREEPLCDGSCGAKPDRPHRHGVAAAQREGKP